MKSTFDGFISILDNMNKRIREVLDITIQTSQTEKHINQSFVSFALFCFLIPDLVIPTSQPYLTLVLMFIQSLKLWFLTV